MPINKMIDGALGRAWDLNRKAARRGLNLFDWAFRRDELVQSGKTWFELVHDTDLMSVRYYGLPDQDEIELPTGEMMRVERNQHAIPLVLVPPLGVTSNTFDLMPNRSLARYMAAKGFRTYLIDWGKPQIERDGNLSLADYTGPLMEEALASIRAHAGGAQDLSMMGWCMGGLLSLMYTGRGKDKHIRNIITVASPVDIRSSKYVVGFADALDAPAHLIERVVRATGMMQDATKMSTPEWMTTLSFKLTDPIGAVTTYWDLLSGLGDRDFVKNYTTTSDYLNNMYVYPGGVVRDVMVQMAGHNKLAQGEIELDGEIARINKVDSNMLVFAGKKDILVEVDVARALIDIVPGPDKQFRVVQGGHMGVILGRKAFGDVWEPSADWLAERSKKQAA